MNLNETRQKLADYDNWLTVLAGCATADNCISSIYIYSNELSIYLSKGTDDDKRQLVRDFVSSLEIPTLKRQLDSPDVLFYEALLTSARTKVRLEFHDYPVNYTVECQKTCYAVYPDGTRKALVKATPLDTGASDVVVDEL